MMRSDPAGFVGLVGEDHLEADAAPGSVRCGDPAAVQGNELAGEGEAEAGARLRGVMLRRCLDERFEDLLEVGRVHARPVVLHDQQRRAVRAADRDAYAGTCWRVAHRVRQQVRHDPFPFHRIDRSGDRLEINVEVAASKGRSVDDAVHQLDQVVWLSVGGHQPGRQTIDVQQVFDES
jgi:hypothetical protein